MTKEIVISGKVAIGMGRGRYFMQLKEYRKQFVKMLKMNPYSGTLNLKLSKTNSMKLALIKKRKGILVKGFRKKDKKFGDVICYRADIGSIKCAIVMPKLSTHTDVVEIISATRLRTAMKLKEGSIVKVLVKA